MLNDDLPFLPINGPNLWQHRVDPHQPGSIVYRGTSSGALCNGETARTTDDICPEPSLIVLLTYQCYAKIVWLEATSFARMPRITTGGLHDGRITMRQRSLTNMALMERIQTANPNGLPA